MVNVRTTTGKKTFNTDVEIRAETGDGVVRSNLWEKSMSDKELNTPMNREQLNTPRELTAEELDMVFGGANTVTEGQDDSQGDEQLRVVRVASNRETSAPSINEIRSTSGQ